MRHTKYKLLWAWEYDREEKWLNEMSEKGLALVSVGLCKYIFEDCNPGEYAVRIELLDHLPCTADSKKYIRFLEETGVEHIGSMLRWVYLRKKTSDGPFALYSDIESKMKYIRRLMFFFIALLFLEFGVAAMNLSIGIGFGNWENITMGFFLLFLGVMCVIAVYQHAVKLRSLKQERRIRE